MSLPFRCFWVLLPLLLIFGERGRAALRLEVMAGGSEVAHGNNTRFSLANARGDVTTQVDAAANVTWQASYEAFGTRTREKGLNWDAQRANSKDEDPTGLLNEGFRYRDLEAGVFISRDPAGFVDGPNVYCYVVQNPWTAWDPLGLSKYYWWEGGWLREDSERIIEDPVREIKATAGACIDAAVNVPMGICVLAGQGCDVLSGSGAGGVGFDNFDYFLANAPKSSYTSWVEGGLDRCAKAGWYKDDTTTQILKAAAPMLAGVPPKSVPGTIGSSISDYCLT